MMKVVFIVFNQSNTGRVEYMLDELKIAGFTFFEQVQGRGTNGGVPHRGTHAWPEMNSAVMTVVEDDKVDDAVGQKLVVSRLEKLRVADRDHHIPLVHDAVHEKRALFAV